MSISTTTNKAGPYDCDGADTQFAYDFRIEDESHIAWYLVDADDNATQLTLNVDYTLTGVGEDTGGIMTTTTTYEAPYRIVGLRAQPLTQLLSLIATRGNDPEATEAALDAAVMALQMHDEALERVTTADPGGTPAAEAANVQTYKEISDATYTLQATDLGALLKFTVDCTVTLPSTLRELFWCVVRTNATSTITLSATGTLESAGTVVPAGHIAAMLTHETTGVWYAGGGVST